MRYPTPHARHPVSVLRLAVKRAATCTLVVCVSALFGCDNGAASTHTAAPADTSPAQAPPINATQMSLIEVQVRLETLVKFQHYREATDLLQRLDLPTYIKDAAVAGPMVRPQYWAIAVEGAELPMVDGVAGLSKEQKQQIESDAWVLPDSATGSAKGDEGDWRHAAGKRASQFNTLLHDAVRDQPQ